MTKRLNPVEFEHLVDDITQQVMSKLKTDGSSAPMQHASSECTCTDGRCVRECSDRVKVVVANGAGRITSGLGYIPRDLSIARLIDHTLLKPDASAAEIAQLCREAREYHFASVCVNSSWVPLCADLLKGSDVAVCTVVGFPLGATMPGVKAYEAQLAIQNGASEIDMVMNIGALKSRNVRALHHDIATVVKNTHAHNVICKVILE